MSHNTHTHCDLCYGQMHRDVDMRDMVGLEIDYQDKKKLKIKNQEYTHNHLCRKCIKKIKKLELP